MDSGERKHGRRRNNECGAYRRADVERKHDAPVNREAGAGGGTTTAAATPVPAGAGGGANRGMSGSTYILEPGSKPGSQDLSAHAGHKVEITGTLAGTPNPGAAAAGTSADSTRATAATTQTSANARIDACVPAPSGCVREDDLADLFVTPLDNRPIAARSRPPPSTNDWAAVFA